MIRKTFSFTDKEVLEYLGKMDKGEVSRYVSRLIREDMKKERVLTRDDVIKLIKEYR
jgi:hypothetical protein